MSKKRDDLKQIVNEALANETYTLYSLDWGKKGPDWKLEVYLDKPGGISTKECVNFSHKLSEILDEIDIIDRSYQL
ncbi:MAG: ribosome maturation factor RimP, partial [Candidatus Bipolaricaulota bacterium]